MKTKRKFLSIIIAFAMLIGAFNLPTIVSGIANASEVQDLIMSSTYTVKNNIKDAKFDISSTTTEDYTIRFANYLTSATNVQASLWAPNGEQLVEWEDASISTHQFQSSGLYCVQYRLTGDVYVYSDQYFIPVENSLEAIKLTQKLSNTTAKSGSLVTIPAVKTEGVDVKVYDPYGAEVGVTTNGGVKTFTNKTNVKGTYYIEYALKNAGTLAGVSVTARKYLTVTFGDSYGTVTTTDIEEKYTFELGDVQDMINDKAIHYFREYDLSTIKLLNPEGEEVSGATIEIELTNDKGTDLTETLISDEKKFMLDETVFEDVKSGSLEGREYKFVISATYNDEDIEDYEVKLVSKLYMEAITFGYDGTFPSEILTNSGLIDFSGSIIFKVDEKYDESLYNKLFSGSTKELLVECKDKNKNTITPSDMQDGKKQIVIENTGEGGDGYIYIDGLTLDFTSAENKFKDKDYYNLTLTFRYAYSGKEFSKDGINGYLNPSYTVRVADETNDTVKPYDIVIESYDSVLELNGETEVEFVLPSLTATDLDSSGNKTNGVVVTISDGTNSYKMGDKVTLTSAGITKFTYTIADTCGNKVTKVVAVKVLGNGSGAVTPNDSIKVDLTGEKYTVEFNTPWIHNAVLYTEDGCVAPSKVVYENNLISTIEFTHKEKFVIVFSATSNDGTIYVGGTRVGYNLTEVTPYSYSDGKASEFTITLYENENLSAYVGDQVALISGNDTGNFTIETKDGLFRLSEGNIVKFLKAGTYKITESGRDSATVVVKDGAIENIYDDIQNPIVATKGTTVKLNQPIFKNYFGYKLTQTVVSTAGETIEIVDGAVILQHADLYTVKNVIEFAGNKTYANYTISTGAVIKPTISIQKEMTGVTWTGETIKYVLSGATAVDKLGNPTNVEIIVEDANGKTYEVKTDSATGEKYVEVKNAGVYTVRYIARDAEHQDNSNYTAIETTNFVVNYPETEEKENNGWKIFGIVVGSLAGVALVAFLVFFFIKKNKKKNQFINKAKQEKKQEKTKVEGKLYTLAQSKDESTWILKCNNRTIAKTKSKQEAVDKVEPVKNEQIKIKVYNKNGRLVDTIEK